MLLIKIDINLSLSAPEHLDHSLTLIVSILPSIYKMENIVVWKLKPLNLVSILAMSLHDPVSSRLFLVILENKFALKNEVDSELHRQVRENNVVLSDWEVMDHSYGGDGDLHA